MFSRRPRPSISTGDAIPIGQSRRVGPSDAPSGISGRVELGGLVMETVVGASGTRSKITAVPNGSAVRAPSIMHDQASAPGSMDGTAR